jgi:hypothetical protein
MHVHDTVFIHTHSHDAVQFAKACYSVLTTDVALLIHQFPRPDRAETVSMLIMEPTYLRTEV